MGTPTDPAVDIAPADTQVDCSKFGTNPLELTSGLTINSIINPIENTMQVELIYEGQVWIGLGFTAGQAVMIGSEAVLGLPGAANSPVKYDLNGKSVPGVQPMSDASQTLTEESIEQNSTHTVLKFTKQLVENGEHPISATEENTFLWAIGGSNTLGIHASRDSQTFLPAQCSVFVGGVLQNPEFVDGVNGGAGDDNRGLWVTHGLCASLAWAILVPLAIGSSLIRRVLEETFGWPNGVWFQIHRALNAMAAILTLIAFAIAFYLISQVPGAKHFSQIPHHIIGLLIFLFTMMQAIGGIFRPHLPHQEPSGDDERAAFDDEAPKSNAGGAETKSTSRIVWEYSHRILGVLLLLTAWWQVQNGLGLFAQRFNETEKKGAFFAVIGVISGTFGALYIYQAVKLTKRT
jgi:uncharacterized membrane protein